MSQSILVVDDSATVRRVVGRTLARAGYEVLLATDGRDAIEQAQQRVPDLVLVDFVMPGMNGFQLVMAMRRIANLADVPVVLMSAKADKIGDGFLAQTGALDAITKPFSPEALLAVAGHALSRAADDAARDTHPPPKPSAEDRLSNLPDEPSSQEPPSETTPAKLAQAAEAIATRLASLLVEHAGGIDVESLATRLRGDMEPDAVFAIVEELAAMVPGRDGEVAFGGRIEHVGLGEILQLLQHQRQTGVLEIEKRPSASGRSVSVCLKDGAVQIALGRVTEQEFRLGRFLLREELLDREDLDRILKARAPGQGLLGVRLVKLGYISADELRGVLERQTSELVYEALRWRRGRYRFLRFASRPEADDANLGLPLAAILMEGTRRVDEWRLIEEQIGSFDDVPRRDEEALRTVDMERLSAEERRVLETVDGERTVREIVDAARMSSFEACKILFQMLTSRLLRVG